MRKYLLLPLIFVTNNLLAQVPDDVLRYSFYPQNGTARSLAIGGAMGSLGGDISAAYANPAGLGNYKTGEFVFTPGFFFNKNKADFRNTKSNINRNNFGIGPIGLVFGSVNQYDPTSSSAFSIAVTQTANFNNTVQYRGLNNSSSFSEQWSEQIANSGQPFEDVLGNPSLAFGAAPAVYTFLLDTFPLNDGSYVIKTLPEFLTDNGQALLQQKTIETRGGIHEIALGFASNKRDRLMIGGTLGIPIVNYRNTTTFRESDSSSITNNGFDYFEYTDNFKTTGAGVNVKLGIIYRLQERIRLGAAIHTPTYMFSLKDTRKTNLETNTENYNGQASASSDIFTNNQSGESRYTMLTPWKFMVSGSYVLTEIEDVRQQKGFITADIEYVTHRSTGFYSAQEVPSDEDIAYYKGLNQVISNQYKGNFNFRLGGELKFNVIMARLGFAYYTNPYKDKALKASRMLVSGGIGYRNKGFFIDLTYIQSFNRDVDFAYRLQDKANTFASLKNSLGNIVASVGFKF